MRHLAVARLDREQRQPTNLYFIQSGCAEGHIKIGIASQVAKRMGKMQMDCPYKLTLLKLVKNAAHMERQLHERFASWRIRGEWFVKTPELLEVIAGLPGYEAPKITGVDGIPIVDAVDDPTSDRIEELALELWRERESRFPERVRRANPDQTDFITGAWGHIFAEAKSIVERQDR